MEAQERDDAINDDAEAWGQRFDGKGKESWRKGAKNRKSGGSKTLRRRSSEAQMFGGARAQRRGGAKAWRRSCNDVEARQCGGAKGWPERSLWKVRCYCRSLFAVVPVHWQRALQPPLTVHLVPKPAGTYAGFKMNRAGGERVAIRLMRVR